MFAALVFEKGNEPLTLQDVPAGVLSWVQTWGAWAAFGLALWLAFGYTRMRPADRARIPRWLHYSVLGLTVAAAAAYLPLLYYWMKDLNAWYRGMSLPPESPWSLRTILLTTAGGCAIVAVCLPLAANLPALRLRRIWALARLSFKEALRRRVLYAFSAVLLVFLFATWFIPHKPEDQVRTYVDVVFYVAWLLIPFTAAVLAAFSIPTDVRQQTIHTVVTKPVERFEIFLGRFLGFTALLSLVLLVMTAVSLLFVLRGVDPLAAAESLKARDPVYGQLHFMDSAGGTGDTGIRVGREWDYRSHISRGMPGTPQLQAVWTFDHLPSGLGGRGMVSCEFTFDVYRTSKGYENRGIPCAFAFETSSFDPTKIEKYRTERDRLIKQGQPAAQVDNDLAREHGYYEVRAFDVVDYHTQHIDLPGALIDNALARGPQATTPALTVRVACLSTSQYVGMARYDLYLRADDPGGTADTARFGVNFIKGALGLWLLVSVVVCLAVAVSAYFSGVITLIIVAVLCLCGFLRGFIQEMAQGTAPEGGPIQSLVKIARRDPGVGTLGDSAVERAATYSDAAFRRVFRLWLSLIPDVGRYDLTKYVAEGFNVPGLQLSLAAGMFLGYVLPWTVLAFYLMRWREIAGNQ
jgi:hypothetical protein